MPYTIKTVDVGEYKTTYIYAERPAAAGRNKKSKPTSDAQEKLNERMSEARFRDIVHLNFTPNDIAVRLDYAKYIKKEGKNPTVEIAQSRLRYYFRKLKKVYDALCIALDYVYVIEVGKRSGKVHHHLILRGAADADIRMLLRHTAEELWAYGYANSRTLEFDENGVCGLVHYFLKDPSTTRRWACSLGLKRPSEEDGSITKRKNAISAKAAKYIDANPYDTDFIVKNAVGDSWVPAHVRVTATASLEDARPYEIPGVTIPKENVYDGMVLPDYGGVFIEIWSYREGTDYFTPATLDPRLKRSKKKKNTEKTQGGTCL